MGEELTANTINAGPRAFAVGGGVALHPELRYGFLWFGRVRLFSLCESAEHCLCDQMTFSDTLFDTTSKINANTAGGVVHVL